MTRTMHSANEWKNIREKETVETDRQYSERYDSYYSKIQDEWIEHNCIDPDCEFCIDRPEKPSMCEGKDAIRKT